MGIEKGRTDADLDSHLILSVMLLGADVSMAAVGHRMTV